MASKIFVVGGSGYIGKKICEEALNNQYSVTGLSRGPAPAELNGKNPKALSWISGDAINKALYQNELPNSQALVHTIGILFESSFMNLLTKRIAADKLQTYEKANKDSALVPLQELENLAKQNKLSPVFGPKPFVYLSAAGGVPFNPRYLSTKEQVEKRMLELGESKVIRPLIFKPGLVYSDNKYKLAGKFFNCAYTFDSYLNKLFGRKIGIPKPVQLDCLAKAVIKGIANPKVQGVFNTQEIESLSKM